MRPIRPFRNYSRLSRTDWAGCSITSRMSTFALGISRRCTWGTVQFWSQTTMVLMLRQVALRLCRNVLPKLSAS